MQRWKQWFNSLVTESDGDWVKYEDHLAELTRQRERIAELEEWMQQALLGLDIASTAAYKVNDKCFIGFVLTGESGRALIANGG